MARVHIVGAGLAGLSAAVELAGANEVALYEAAPQAGGRCRSYFDASLDMTIDNGNHLAIRSLVKHAAEKLRFIADGSASVVSLRSIVSVLRVCTAPLIRPRPRLPLT